MSNINKGTTFRMLCRTLGITTTKNPKESNPELHKHLNKAEETVIKKWQYHQICKSLINSQIRHGELPSMVSVCTQK